MLKQREITLDRGYVNESKKLIRRVNQEIDPWTIRYSLHDLETGTLVRSPRQICKKRDVIKWANREATEEELHRLNDEIDSLYRKPDVSDHEVRNGEIHAHTHRISLLR